MTTTTDVSNGFGPDRTGTALFARLAAPVARYLRYRRTLGELAALSTDSLLDLDLYRGDLRRIARHAVYD